MPFNDTLHAQVDGYARADLPGDIDWHVEYFSFLACDEHLQRKLGHLFFSTRYLYKVLEGIVPRLNEDSAWALEAEVRFQVLNYASIYEACLHHLLFVELVDDPAVRSLTQQRSLRPFSVSAAMREELAGFEAGLSAIPTPNSARLAIGVYADTSIQEDRVRFPQKSRVSCELGLISEATRAIVDDVYRARNKIHLHAEIKAGGTVFSDLEFAKMAYMRLEGFKQEITAWRARSALDAVDAVSDSAH